MFRKLCKYEWTAMMRAMFPIYGALLAVSLINGLLFNLGLMENSGLGALPIAAYIQVIAVFSFVAVMAAMAVFTIVVIIQRFYKGLLRQEGYLMFTLPVKTWQLTFSKACISLIMACFSMIVGCLSLGLLFSANFFPALFSLPRQIASLISEAVSYDAAGTLNFGLFCLELLAAVLVSAFGSLYHLYLSMSLGQLSKNHKIAFSVLWYIVINAVLNLLEVFLLNLFLFLPDMVRLLNGSILILHLIGLGLLFLGLVKTVLFAGTTNWILDRKLNL